ncbi:hypothetical protein DY052_06100 [Apilactobacillus timberlakei]|uniref:hypothetical protein n=1 Tax=Apilactobacillus timberlakei TaxID=2008380 RepID=UPI001125D161|nr:hypothetical protein [Apilactobacillus timberlakei]TPR14996.1 hypothetical protein DY052_06100 [Apilactobacillus timberlakei]
MTISSVLVCMSVLVGFIVGVIYNKLKNKVNNDKNALKEIYKGKKWKEDEYDRKCVIPLQVDLVRNNAIKRTLEIAYIIYTLFTIFIGINYQSTFLANILVGFLGGLSLCLVLSPILIIKNIKKW